MNRKQNLKTQMQEDQYIFPYHHIPYIMDGFGLRRSRHWSSSMEYICRLQQINEIVKKLKPTSVLEMGCGDGRLIGSLSSVPYRVGYDISDRALHFAKAFYPTVTFTNTLIDVQSNYELVIASEVLEHIPEVEIKDFIVRCINRMKNGSFFLVSVPTTNNPLIEKHFRHYNKQKLLNTIFNVTQKLNLTTIRYILVKSKLVSFYNMLTLNKYWTVDIPLLNTVLLNYLKKISQTANEDNGSCMIAIFKKTI